MLKLTAKGISAGCKHRFHLKVMFVSGAVLRAERLQQAAAVSRRSIAYSVFPDAVCPFIADYLMDIYHKMSVLRSCGVLKHSEIPQYNLGICSSATIPKYDVHSYDAQKCCLERFVGYYGPFCFYSQFISLNGYSCFA